MPPRKRSPMALQKYTPSSGIPELRAAIAGEAEEREWARLQGIQVIVNCGAKHSCFNAILATCQAGDEVIIPRRTG